MRTPAATETTSANLQVTSILDYQDGIVRDLAGSLRRQNPEARKLLQSAHRYLVDFVKPVYALNELQPASKTLRQERAAREWPAWRP
jgi:hypothetical protein